MARYLTSALTWLGVLMARPTAFLILACYLAAWLVLSPQSFDWHAIATGATWLMTLFIQRAEHRDTRPSMPSSTSCCVSKVALAVS